MHSAPAVVTPVHADKPRPAFVELDVGQPGEASECTVEMENPRGARMRICLKGSNAQIDVSAVARFFWGGGV